MRDRVVEFLKTSYAGKLIDIPKKTAAYEISNYFRAWADDILGSDSYRLIEFIPIFSLDVMPCTVKLEEDNVNLLLWDEHYWFIYDLFLTVCDRFLKVNQKAEFCSVSEELSSILLLYLSARFDSSPALSRYTIEEYLRLTHHSRPYERYQGMSYELYFGTLYNASEIGKMFGVCHELAHIAFRENKEIAIKTQNSIINYCDAYLRLVSLKQELCVDLDFDVSEKYLNGVNLLREILDDAKGITLEEISCDVIAISTLIRSLAWQGYCEEYIIDSLYDLQIFFLFDWWRSSNEKMWKMFKDVFEEPIKNDCAFVDDSHPYYRYGTKNSNELAQRLNFPLAYCSSKFNLPMNNKSRNEKYQKIFDFVTDTDAYMYIDSILVRYQRSKKDIMSLRKHREIRDKKIGWRRINL